MQTNNQIPVFQNNPIMVLLFSFLTCGLYLIWWNMKIAEVMNAINKKETISKAIAIFSGCCLPVNVYFYYLIGKDCMPNLYKEINEEPKDKSTMLLILGFLLPMVAAFIVQGEVNKLYSKE